MRIRGFAEECSMCYCFIKMLGFTKSCFACNADQFTCAENNYILQFTGSGKYNNKFLCLQCLEKRINLPKIKYC